MTQTFEELVKEVQYNPAGIVTLEIIAKHKDFINLVVDGNKTVEAKLILLLGHAVIRGYERAIADSMEDLRRMVKEYQREWEFKLEEETKDE